MVVKQSNSDTVLTAYNCSVNINGTIINPYDLINYTDFHFNMTPLDRYSGGSIIWNKPVNTTFIKENWNSMFDVFVRNITFKLHNESIRVNNMEFTDLGDDNMTMNFTVSLYEPYLLGLLLKRSDRFWV